MKQSASNQYDAHDCHVCVQCVHVSVFKAVGVYTLHSHIHIFVLSINV